MPAVTDSTLTRKMTRSSNRTLQKILISLALFVAVIVVYFPMRHCGFINLDDPRFVTENPNIRSGLTWQSVRWSFTAGLLRDDPNADYWRPVSFLGHALDITLFGLNPAGHHLMNVGIHAVAAVALFLVLQSMTGASWRSAFVAALFALHPLRVESVAWVTEQKDVLGGLFFVLTLGAYVRYVRGPFSIARYLLVFVLFALALMSKAMVMTLPFVLLLLDYWPLGRMSGAQPATEATDRATKTPGELVKEKVPLFALMMASCLATFLMNHAKNQTALLQVPFGTRIGNILISYVAYIGKMLWPINLAVWYPLHLDLSVATALVAGVGLVAFTIVVISNRQQRPWLVTGWFWYLGMLVPVIGLFQGAGEAMADRFTYLPSIGLTIMLCWSVPCRSLDRRDVRIGVGIVGVAALAACAVLSRIQIGYWNDSETLLQHAVAVTQGNWLAETNLGTALMRSGRTPEAIDHFESALQAKPDLAEAYYDLGNASGRLGRTDEAIGYYEHALRINTDYVEAHCNLGIALMQMGRTTEAIPHLEQAVRLMPGHVEAQYNLATALGMTGRTTEAIEHFQAVLQIQPGHKQARNNLGMALAALGKYADAIEQYQFALQIDPAFLAAHFNLGMALEKMGKVPEAIQQYQQALQIKPDYAAAQNALVRLQTSR